jgi:hypothetical protein
MYSSRELMSLWTLLQSPLVPIRITAGLLEANDSAGGKAMPVLKQ